MPGPGTGRFRNTVIAGLVSALGVHCGWNTIRALVVGYLEI